MFYDKINVNVNVTNNNAKKSFNVGVFNRKENFLLNEKKNYFLKIFG